MLNYFLFYFINHCLSLWESTTVDLLYQVFFFWQTYEQRVSLTNKHTETCASSCWLINQGTVPEWFMPCNLGQGQMPNQSKVPWCLLSCVKYSKLVSKPWFCIGWVISHYKVSCGYPNFGHDQQKREEQLVIQHRFSCIFRNAHKTQAWHPNSQE